MECAQSAQVANAWQVLTPAWQEIRESDNKAKARETGVEGLPANLPAGREKPVVAREQKGLNVAKHKVKMRSGVGTAAQRSKQGKNPKDLVSHFKCLNLIVIHDFIMR